MPPRAAACTRLSGSVLSHYPLRPGARSDAPVAAQDAGGLCGPASPPGRRSRPPVPPRAAACTRLSGSVLSHYPLRPGARSDAPVAAQDAGGLRAGGLPPGGARLRPPRAAACTRLSGSVLSHYPLRPGARSDPPVAAQDAGGRCGPASPPGRRSRPPVPPRAAACTRLSGSVLSHYPLRPGARSDAPVAAQDAGGLCGPRRLPPRRSPPSGAASRRLAAQDAGGLCGPASPPGRGEPPAVAFA